MLADRFLHVLRGPDPDRDVRMGTIDPAYVEGSRLRPRVVFDGETAASTRRYATLTGYEPAPGDRVVLARTGSTWTVLGAVPTAPALAVEAFPTTTYYTSGNSSGYIADCVVPARPYDRLLAVSYHASIVVSVATDRWTWMLDNTAGTTWVEVDTQGPTRRAIGGSRLLPLAADTGVTVRLRTLRTAGTGGWDMGVGSGSFTAARGNVDVLAHRA